MGHILKPRTSVFVGFLLILAACGRESPPAQRTSDPVSSAIRDTDTPNGVLEFWKLTNPHEWEMSLSSVLRHPTGEQMLDANIRGRMGVRILDTDDTQITALLRLGDLTKYRDGRQMFIS